MGDKKQLIKVGVFDTGINDILGLDIEPLVIYRSKGLPAHMAKKNHNNCFKYIDYIPDIIENPDYIGVNPNEAGASIEYVKRYKNNVLLGVKLDADEGYLYVATMHDIQESKIKRRLHSGRLKEVKK